MSSSLLGMLLGIAVGARHALEPDHLAPLAHLARRPVAARALCAATGALSAGLGLVWGWPLAGRLLS